MRTRQNIAPTLGPDVCEMPGCGLLAQVSLSATGQALQTIGFSPSEGERLSMRVCSKCYLRAMDEVLARSGLKRRLQSAASLPTIQPEAKP